MKKVKKVLGFMLVIALTITGTIGATVAYLSDKDAQKNTFTVGNVAIDLWEDFGDNDENGLEELHPSTGKDADGNIINAVEKEVYVTNTGSEDAYVRVHIAIPQILDNGDPDFDAGKNVLHFNYAPESIGADKWDWSKLTSDSVPHYTAKTDDKYDGDWNFYTVAVGKNSKGEDIWYNVYVVTYEKALAKDESTVDAMHQVYLDGKVTNEDVASIDDKLGDDAWKILVVAEGVQAKGFDDAYTALNTAFGTPGSYTIDWATVSGKTWGNND